MIEEMHVMSLYGSGLLIQGAVLVENHVVKKRCKIVHVNPFTTEENFKNGSICCFIVCDILV